MHNWLGIRISSIIYKFNAKSMLDVGCGLGTPTKNLDIPFKVAVDIYKEYLYKVKDYMFPINCNALDVGNLFKKPFDIVTCLDVIEHLEKEDGLKLKSKLENICNKVIIFYTPNGYVKQELHNGKDAWGYNNKFQVHLSGFEPSNFNGYNIEEYKNRSMFLAWKKI